ncbi:hypothetical protein PV726_09380 [Streptomyces europaeiscabiei]|uniref:hypothetical protein n=1 Tax=Streptomyces europaeiscabiei TaxID=146819 RepID=UPI0029B096EB|nr:hypothetical protein [Streptomyces europaeiscabiei]MDX3690529.1 hypothetical protein [Streptomyces europaeiscabiei]
MADYEAHAHKAQELLESIENEAKGRLTHLDMETRTQMAQVEALLALAATIDNKQGRGSASREGRRAPCQGGPTS